MSRFNSKKAFSLIEVLVFISILSIVFIVAATVATVSIRNTKNAESKILATRYAEELMEWLQGQKEMDWTDFKTNKAIGTYCFSEEPITSWSSIGTCTSNELINSLYNRQVTLDYDGLADRIDVLVKVSWNEGGNTVSIPLNSIFTQFQ